MGLIAQAKHDIRHGWPWISGYIALMAAAWSYGEYREAAGTRAAGLEDYRPIDPCSRDQDGRPADCAAYRAGHDWAERNEPYSGRDCPRRAEAFYQGCLEFVRFAAEAARPDPPE